ncbi:MAG: helix-turn-helix domain-containing protein [Acidobacteriota bacterium]
MEINTENNVNASEVEAELNNARIKLINNYLLTNCVSENLPLKLFINSIEEELIEKALKITKGNQRIASKILGMKATTLNEKIRKYDISNPKKYKLQIELFHLLQNSKRFEFSMDQK